MQKDYQIKPYEGNEDYIFISYAHKDSDRVLQIVKDLTDVGFRIWYDEGIDPGTEWPESIANHLRNSRVCIAFISESSIISQNCRREINYALSQQIGFLSVVLEEVHMSPGLEMQISSYQSMIAYKYPSHKVFAEKLASLDLIACCRGTETASDGTGAAGDGTAPASGRSSGSAGSALKPTAGSADSKSDIRTVRPSGQKVRGPGKLPVILIAVAAVVVVIIIAVVAGGGSGKKTADTASASSASASSTSAPSALAPSAAAEKEAEIETDAGAEQEKQAETDAQSQTTERKSGTDKEKEEQVSDASSQDLTSTVVFKHGLDPTYMPYSYFDDSGNVAGFDVELAKAVCDYYDWEYLPVPLDWNDKDEELNNGSCDCIWSGFTTNGRENDYLWSSSYADISYRVIVKKHSKIKTIADLAGKRVGVTVPSGEYRLLTTEKADLTSTFASLKEYDSLSDAYDALKSGDIEAIAVDMDTGRLLLDEDSEIGFLEEELGYEEYAVAFKKGNTELRDKVNNALEALFASGTVYEIGKNYPQLYAYLAITKD